jgi:hypothetical protein
LREAEVEAAGRVFVIFDGGDAAVGGEGDLDSEVEPPDARTEGEPIH